MIMEQDQRQNPRYKLQGIHASITFIHPPLSTLCLNGEVVDFSCTGIKIKLNSPFSAIMDGSVKILLVLPASGIPLSITGNIKHQAASECGLEFEDNYPEDAFNELMFECSKSV